MTEIETPAVAPKPKYGSFNVRMLASMVDLGLVAIVTTAFVDWIMDRLYGPADTGNFLSIAANPDLAKDSGKLVSALWADMIQQHMLERIVVQNFFDLMCVALYTLPFWFRYSSTPGKMLFGYTIRDAKTGARMTRKQAVQRFLAYIIAFLPLTLGFVWMIFNKKRQGLHDLLANTVVIKKPKEEPAATVIP